jgi:RNA polymerase sigma-70 factor (ECF subfamily)
MSEASKMVGHQLPSKDSDLLERCRAGDRPAREELARACLPRVRRTVLLATGGGPDTDDLVQSTMVRVFAGLDGFRGEAKFSTWLDRVTINAVREHFRRRTLVFLFPSGESRDALPAPASQEPDRRLEGQRLLERLSVHLAAIRPKKRMALILSTAYGYSVSEVAELTDCTTETAKKRLQHGRRELIARLQQDPRLASQLKEIGR